jgi:hypothetical protein
MLQEQSPVPILDMRRTGEFFCPGTFFFFHLPLHRWLRHPHHLFSHPFCLLLVDVPYLPYL